MDDERTKYSNFGGDDSSRQTTAAVSQSDSEGGNGIVAGENFPPVRGGESPHTLGKFYRVTRQIGEGGMGVVYEVEHTKMGKKFAAKVISKFFASDPDAIKRFELEAIAASKIDSPHIVQVVHLDTEGEYTYIVMELLKGKNLAAVAHKKILSVQLAVEIARQVARGLIAAHEAGIVHRDLKPENIFLTNQDGQLYVKILDFGISKIKQGPDSNVRLTKTGQIIGTPLYFSPEQARGTMDVDGRTDIYALGAILFEMVTGRPVFEAQNPIDLMMKHATEPPPRPSTINSAVPAELERIILKCLAKEVNERYQTAAQLYADLAAFQTEPLAREAIVSITTQTDPLLQMIDSAPVGMTAIKKKRGTEKILIGSSVVIVIAAVVAGTWYLTIGGGKTPTRESKPKARLEDVFRKTNTSSAPIAEGGSGTGATIAAPQEVTLTITSTPDGAEVWVGDKLLGKTPFIYKASRNETEYAFELKAKGYKPEKVILKASGDEARHIAMTKIKKGVIIDTKGLKMQR